MASKEKEEIGGGFDFSTEIVTLFLLASYRERSTPTLDAQSRARGREPAINVHIRFRSNEMDETELSNVRAASAPRRVALCVFEWSSTTTVVAWAWLRQYFLRKSIDTLFIVHTGSLPGWDKAGPLTPALDESLAGYEHKIFSYSGSLKSNIVDFLKTNDIDLVLVGEDFPRGGKFLTSNPLSSSPAEWVKSHVSVPFMIIRQDSVLRLRGLRISDNDIPLSPMSPKSPSRNCSSARRLAIAYRDERVGMNMLNLARKMVLLPTDEVYMVHCVHSGNVVGGQLMKMRDSLTRMRGKAGGSSSQKEGSGHSRGGSTGGEMEEVGETSGAFFGQDIAKAVILRGGSSGSHKESRDPRHLISQFCENYSIDLLIISSRSAGRLRKTITGGSVSSFLINKVACPCLVIPLKMLGYSGEQEMGRSLTLEGLDATPPEAHGDDDLDAMDAIELRSLVRTLRKELDDLRSIGSS